MKLQHLLLGAAIALSSASLAVAEPIGRSDTPPLLNKIAQYAYVVDTSGSMMMTMPGVQVQKIALAKQVLGELNSRIPSLAYDSALYMVCPAKPVVPASAWDRMTMSKGIMALPVDLPIFGRMTDLGGDLSALQGLPASRGAVILVTDGAENLGNAVDAARQIAASGAQLHIISFADTPNGQATIKAMAEAAPGGVVANGLDMIMSPVALDAFIEAVYYTEDKAIMVDSVYFATGKYALDAAAQSTLDTLAAQILNIPHGVRTVVIEGFTDQVGGYGYGNSALSYNRAQAVREYLIGKGVPAEKIYFKGNSISHKFANNNSDGRLHNRRADIIIN